MIDYFKNCLYMYFLRHYKAAQEQTAHFSATTRHFYDVHVLKVLVRNMVNLGLPIYWAVLQGNVSLPNVNIY